MKDLIIGAAGFVGSYLIALLNSENHTVYATILPHEKLNCNAQIIHLDICNYNLICKVINEVKPDVIYHLAAQSSVKLSWEKPNLTAQINILGAINLFEAVRVYSPYTKVIVIGSSEEYGEIDYREAVKEETVPNPSNIYALTKYSQEGIAKIYVKAYGLNIVLTRSFNHIGPGQSPQFVVADFCNQVANIEKGLQENVIKVGNLGAYRDFSDVRDVVRAYLILAKRGVSGEIYNVGRGKSIQINEILNILLTLSKVNIQIEIDKNKFRPIDVPNICADITKINQIGWRPKISLKQSITETLNYFRGTNEA